MGDPLRNRSRDAAFFCYHSIHAEGPRWLSVSPSLFERQLQYLRRAGWHAGSEADLIAATNGTSPTRPTVFLTFDDGFFDNFTSALPLLQEYRYAGIFFVLPSHLAEGAAFSWPEVAEDQRRFPGMMRSMTWAQVEAMAEAGMEFGSHGLSHLHLPTLGEEELRQELLDSRRAVEQRLGRCTMLAYPFGDWDGRVAAAAKAAGYAFAFTLPRSHQAAADALTIPRIAVDYRDDIRRFSLKVRPTTRRLYLSRGKELVRPGRLSGRSARADGLLVPPALLDTSPALVDTLAAVL
jgi:peptidoglycan/xylan/chitin deacetylase (PgdA/CDA1 family)